jgi:uncharacterized protein YqeY
VVALLEKLRNDLKQTMLTKDEEKKNTIKMVLGEIPRLNKLANEIPTDAEVEGIIRKLIKSETQVLELTKKDINQSEYIKVLSSYLPQSLSKEEIKEWISSNIDLSKYDNPIKAMGEIMKALKGKVDGGVVRNILTNIY